MNNTKAMDMDLQERDRPKLTVDEQITLLKDKGVEFKLCGEQEARRWLADYSYYLDVCAYRRLFDKHVGGAHDGQYANLDFAYLVDLWQIDRQLRHTMLPLTLDIEHYAKTKVMRMIAERDDEDGYSIIVDYLNSLDAEGRRRRREDIERLEDDCYNGALARKYRDAMPSWVAVKLWSFGSFIDFYRFCAKRWKDAAMKQEYHLLRFVRSARNGYAHSACTLATLGKADSHLQTQMQVINALIGVATSKASRKAKMRCSSIQQIVTTIYAHTVFVKDETVKREAVDAIDALMLRMDEHGCYYERNDVIRSGFAFLEKAFEILQARL